MLGDSDGELVDLALVQNSGVDSGKNVSGQSDPGQLAGLTRSSRRDPRVRNPEDWVSTAL